MQIDLLKNFFRLILATECFNELFLALTTNLTLSTAYRHKILTVLHNVSFGKSNSFDIDKVFILCYYH